MNLNNKDLFIYSKFIFLNSFINELLGIHFFEFTCFLQYLGLNFGVVIKIVILNSVSFKSIIDFFIFSDHIFLVNMIFWHVDSLSLSQHGVVLSKWFKGNMAQSTLMSTEVWISGFTIISKVIEACNMLSQTLDGLRK